MLNIEAPTAMTVIVRSPDSSRIFLLDSPQFQVFGSVVIALPVLVMDSLVILQWSPQDLLHDVAVFSLPPTGDFEFDVSPAVECSCAIRCARSTAPFVERLGGICTTH
jgi:hypothetical protein